MQEDGEQQNEEQLEKRDTEDRAVQEKLVVEDYEEIALKEDINCGEVMEKSNHSTPKSLR